MPVPLYPTCIDSCGLMVAVGTREGPVILFHVGPRHASGPCSTMPVRKKPHHETNEPSPAVTSTRRSSSNNSGRSHGRGNRPDGQAGSAVRALRNFSRDTASTSPGRVTGGGGGGGGGATATTVIRVYGSLAGGDGPISAVLLDRSKVIAAGRGSRRYGNKFVIRCGSIAGPAQEDRFCCNGERGGREVKDTTVSCAGRVMHERCVLVFKNAARSTCPQSACCSSTRRIA